jgi:predicted nucleic acid-binding protein
VLEQIETIDSRGWLQVITPDSADEYQLRFRFDSMLDPGEASCLAIAVSRQMILVTDDLAARKLAKDNNVLLTGTLGILIALVRDEIISLSLANQFLAQMIQKNYRSPVKRLDDLI